MATRWLETDTLSNQNISSALEVGSYTADADRWVAAQLFADQVAGNGDYVAYLTMQIGGAGSTYVMLPKTTMTAASGETAIAGQTIYVLVRSGDILKVMLDGLAGDVATPDTIVRWAELDALRPTTADRTLDVDANGGAEVGSFQAGAITAAAIATGAIDADALAADAVTEIWAGSTAPTASAVADQVWDELLAGHAVAGSTGEALTNAGAAATPPTEAEIWSYATRTLTQTAAQVVAAVSGSSLAVVKNVDYTATLTGLTISAVWTKVWFTIKSDKSADDDEAVIQIQESNPGGATDGVLYFNADDATVAQQAQGSLTVDQPNGTIAIDIDDDLTADLEAGRYSYDVKLLTATGTQLLTSGTVNVTETETHAIA